jgi:ABC-type branched-subunit amino acid transport system ATPase component
MRRHQYSVGSVEGVSAGVAASIERVSFAYGPLPVLTDLDLDVRDGEVLGLLGTNGAGKSTVLRVLLGLARPSTGTVRLFGEDVTNLPADERVRRGIALVPGGRGVFGDLTVRENLELGGFLLGSERGDRIERELARFPFLAQRGRQLAGSLSGGQQQQLAIAKALIVDPKILCIDELSLGLSPAVVGELLDTVRAVHAQGVTCVIVEQSLNIAASLCERAVFLEKGQVRFEGAPTELLERGDLARAVFLGAAGA